MMHNPFQSYQTDPTLLAYAGMANPFGLPFTAMQTSPTNPATLNPLASSLGASCATAGLSQLGQTGYAGIPNYGNIHPQQLQLASLLTSQAGIPQAYGQSPIWQNPYAVQNPWITAGLQNPLLNPITQQQFVPQFGLQPLQHSPYQQAGQGLPVGQIGLPYGQIGSPLTPQSWQQPFVPYGTQPYSPYQQIGQGSPFGQQGSPFGQQQGLSFGQQGLPYGQQGSPYAQFGSPFGQPNLPYGVAGSPLAPQSWVGQAGPFGGAQAFGQIHPLLAQQLAARAFHSPWTGF